MSFHGKVVRVDPSFGSNGNPLLIVDHYPLVGFSRKVTLDGLPLDVSILTHDYLFETFKLFKRFNFF